jgi:hypothetical protein
MITKRRFLTGMASTAAVAATVSHSTTSWAATPTAAAAPSAVETPLAPAIPPFDAVVFNERYSDAWLFAQALRAQGVPLMPIAGDAGTLWYGVLRAQVLSGRARFAGMGTPMDLMILESLGREADLRVRFRAHHDARGRKTLTHSISGTRAISRSEGPSLAAELGAQDWPARLAAALPRAASGLIATNIQRSADHPGMLVSWVLARRETT